MMEQSALANDLKVVFHGLKDMESNPTRRPQVLEVAVNGWIRISLPARGPSTASGTGANWPPPRIERYHTILLLIDEDECVYIVVCLWVQDGCAFNPINHSPPN